MIETSKLEEIIGEFLSNNIRRYEVIKKIGREEKEYLSLICLLLGDPEWEVRLKATEILVENKYWLWDRKELVDSVTEKIIGQLVDEHLLTRDKAKDSLKIVPLDVISNVIQAPNFFSSLTWKLALLCLCHSHGFDTFNPDIQSLIKDIKEEKPSLLRNHIYLFDLAVKDYIKSLNPQEVLTWAYPLLEEEYPYSEYIERIEFIDPP